MKKHLRFTIHNQIKTGILQEDRIETSFGEIYELPEVTLLAPCEPTKIICTGLNYYGHIQEMNDEVPEIPLLFLKPPTALIGSMESIIYPQGVKDLHYEAELAVVMGEKCFGVKKEEVKDKILGYTCFNDVTARDLQKKDGQWTRSKSFDTFAPTGPYIVSGIDPKDLKISLYLNHTKRQSSSTRDMIFSIEDIISFASHIMTLLPGDIIATGTPPGVGSMEVGDVVEVEIEGIGRLKNFIKTATKEGEIL